MTKEIKKLNNSELLIYQNADGNINLDVNLEDETVWLSLEQMSRLFGRDKSVISRHIKHIFEEGELEREKVVANFATTTKHGALKGKTQTHFVVYYNLDVVISVGYRVKSLEGVRFRKWATERIKEYIIKGFNLNDDRFINGNKFDKKYFDELLERIKTIRVSERMSYQKITDLFIATSNDYNSKSEEAYTFFKIVQNKMHYAITGHTAAELIYERVDSNKINMGLTNWKNSPDGMIYKYDVSIAKNYLNENELKKLNNLTNLFLDYAEDMAEEGNIMTMQKWIDTTDKLLKFRDKIIQV